MLDIYLRNLKDMLIDPMVRAFLGLKDQGVTPNTFTLMSGVFGLIGIYNSWQNKPLKSFMYFLLNRIFDGIDGTFARMTDQCSDFGGYLDIVVDFTIYGLIPLGVTAGDNSKSEAKWISLVLLEVTFFVNAAGLFFLSALIEKNTNA